MQYSRRPSPLSLGKVRDAREQNRLLWLRIFQRVRAMSPDERPEVVLDPRWDNGAKRIGARGSSDGVEEIREHMRAAFARRTTAEWAEFLATQPEIIFERVQNYDELVVDPQVAANGYLADIDVPGFGTAGVVTNVVHLGATPGRGAHRPPPMLGEHGAEILGEVGYGPEERERLRRDSVI